MEDFWGAVEQGDLISGQDGEHEICCGTAAYVIDFSCPTQLPDADVRVRINTVSGLPSYIDVLDSCRHHTPMYAPASNTNLSQANPVQRFF